MRSNLRYRFDWLLFAIMLLILCFGLVVIMSTTISAETASEGKGAFQLQLIYAVLGIAAFFAMTRINYQILLDWVTPLYIFICTLLILVLLTGSTIYGAKRWLDLGITSIQPSELAKVILLVVLAGVMSRRSRYSSNLHFIAISGLILALPILLILMQPDLGTASMFFFLWLGFLLGLGVDPKYFVMLGLGALAMAPAVWASLKPYQQERILTFMDPMRDPQGAGYNVIQALIAIGSGGIWGLGLGRGKQSQLKFLPVRHTDFIYSVIAEEMGFIGPMILFILYGLLLWKIISIAQKAQDNFGRYLCLGTFILLFSQIFVNVGMNMAIMPVTGITLPLVSSGGSSLWTTMILLGLVQSVQLNSQAKHISSGQLRSLYPLKGD